MSQYKQKIKEIERYPHIKRNWIKTIEWLIDNKWKRNRFCDAETFFRWWISGKNADAFYYDEIVQQKLNFEEYSEQNV